MLLVWKKLRRKRKGNLFSDENFESLLISSVIGPNGLHKSSMTAYSVSRGRNTSSAYSEPGWPDLPFLHIEIQNKQCKVPQWPCLDTLTLLDVSVSF